MFFIHLRLKPHFELYGLVALDRRRELRLPDSARYCTGGSDIKLKVSEAFARARFEPDTINSYRIVDQSVIAPGDAQVITVGYTNPVVGLREDLPADRFIALWIAAGKQ